MVLPLAWAQWAHGSRGLGNYCLCALVRQHKLHWIFITLLCTGRSRSSRAHRLCNKNLTVWALGASRHEADRHRRKNTGNFDVSATRIQWNRLLLDGGLTHSGLVCGLFRFRKLKAILQHIRSNEWAQSFGFICLSIVVFEMF